VTEAADGDVPVHRQGERDRGSLKERSGFSPAVTRYCEAFLSQMNTNPEAAGNRVGVIQENMEGETHKEI